MKNYNKILEAINRGILFALDDFESEDILISKPKLETISKEDSLWQNLKIRENFIDLGLPSGTLWGKTNIGADCDNYAESWYGDYFAWGEIEQTIPYNYNSDNYKFFKNNKITKYCTDPNEGDDVFDDGVVFEDNLILLLPEDNIATIIFGKHANIPTEKQFFELIEYTELKWETNYKDIENLNGTLFTSKINGNQLFIPAAGYYDHSSIENESKQWCCWSSEICIDEPRYARFLTGKRKPPIEININNRLHVNPRWHGYSIRPVYHTK